MAYLNHFLNACLLAGAWFGMVPAIAAAQVADLVIHNARVLQCDAGMSQAEAIAIKDGRILAVGSEAEIQTLVAEGQTKVVNAANQCVTPGLTDSHLHFVGLGHSLQMLDLHAASEWQDIVDQVQQAARLLPKGSWIEGRGWHQSKWTSAPQENVDGYPDHTSLSAAVPDHPVLLTHASGHAVFANAAAMQLAGIGPDTSDPAGGEILRDETGRAIGVFRENAGGLIRRAQARAGERLSQTERVQQTRERVLLAAQACIAHGITSVHDAGSSFAEAQALRELAEDGQLPVRMTVMIREGSQTLSNRLPDFRWIGLADGFLTVRSIKVSIDGALGPHGAWLLEPYTDLATTSGLNTVNIDELERIARLCKEYDWQLCVHAIGDRANREVLDTYQRVLGSQAKSDHRWRVEHAQHLHPTDIPRFGQLGVIPAMQANHCTSDAIFVPARLGERRRRSGGLCMASVDRYRCDDSQRHRRACRTH